MHSTDQREQHAQRRQQRQRRQHRLQTVKASSYGMAALPCCIVFALLTAATSSSATTAASAATANHSKSQEVARNQQPSDESANETSPPPSSSPLTLSVAGRASVDSAALPHPGSSSVKRSGQQQLQQQEQQEQEQQQQPTVDQYFSAPPITATNDHHRPHNSSQRLQLWPRELSSAAHWQPHAVDSQRTSLPGRHQYHPGHHRQPSFEPSGASGVEMRMPQSQPPSSVAPYVVGLTIVVLDLLVSIYVVCIVMYRKWRIYRQKLQYQKSLEATLPAIQPAVHSAKKDKQHQSASSDSPAVHAGTATGSASTVIPLIDLNGLGPPSNPQSQTQQQQQQQQATARDATQSVRTSGTDTIADNIPAFTAVTGPIKMLRKQTSVSANPLKGKLSRLSLLNSNSSSNNNSNSNAAGHNQQNSTSLQNPNLDIDSNGNAGAGNNSGMASFKINESGSALVDTPGVMFAPSGSGVSARDTDHVRFPLWMALFQIVLCTLLVANLSYPLAHSGFALIPGKACTFMGAALTITYVCEVTYASIIAFTTFLTVCRDRDSLVLKLSHNRKKWAIFMLCWPSVALVIAGFVFDAYGGDDRLCLVSLKVPEKHVYLITLTTAAFIGFIIIVFLHMRIISILKKSVKDTMKAMASYKEATTSTTTVTASRAPTPSLLYNRGGSRSELNTRSQSFHRLSAHVNHHQLHQQSNGDGDGDGDVQGDGNGNGDNLQIFPPPAFNSNNRLTELNDSISHPPNTLRRGGSRQSLLRSEADENSRRIRWGSVEYHNKSLQLMDVNHQQTRHPLAVSLQPSISPDLHHHPLETTAIPIDDSPQLTAPATIETPLPSSAAPVSHTHSSTESSEIDPEFPFVAPRSDNRLPTMDLQRFVYQPRPTSSPSDIPTTPSAELSANQALVTFPLSSSSAVAAAVAMVAPTFDHTLDSVIIDINNTTTTTNINALSGSAQSLRHADSGNSGNSQLAEQQQVQQQQRKTPIVSSAVRGVFNAMSSFVRPAEPMAIPYSKRHASATSNGSSSQLPGSLRILPTTIDSIRPGDDIIHPDMPLTGLAEIAFKANASNQRQPARNGSLPSSPTLSSVCSDSEQDELTGEISPSSNGSEEDDDDDDDVDTNNGNDQGRSSSRPYTPVTTPAEFINESDDVYDDEKMDASQTALVTELKPIDIIPDQRRRSSTFTYAPNRNDSVMSAAAEATTTMHPSTTLATTLPQSDHQIEDDPLQARQRQRSSLASQLQLRSTSGANGNQAGNVSRSRSVTTSTVRHSFGVQQSIAATPSVLSTPSGSRISSGFTGLSSSHHTTNRMSRIPNLSDVPGLPETLEERLRLHLQFIDEQQQSRWQQARERRELIRQSSRRPGNPRRNTLLRITTMNAPASVTSTSSPPLPTSASSGLSHGEFAQASFAASSDAEPLLAPSIKAAATSAQQQSQSQQSQSQQQPMSPIKLMNTVASSEIGWFAGRAPSDVYDNSFRWRPPEFKRFSSIDNVAPSSSSGRPGGRLVAGLSRRLTMGSSSNHNNLNVNTSSAAAHSLAAQLAAPVSSPLARQLTRGRPPYAHPNDSLEKLLAEIDASNEAAQRRRQQHKQQRQRQLTSTARLAHDRVPSFINVDAIQTDGTPSPDGIVSPRLVNDATAADVALDILEPGTSSSSSSALQPQPIPSISHRDFPAIPPHQLPAPTPSLEAIIERLVIYIVIHSVHFAPIAIMLLLRIFGKSSTWISITLLSCACFGGVLNGGLFFWAERQAKSRRIKFQTQGRSRNEQLFRELNQDRQQKQQQQQTSRQLIRPNPPIKTASYQRNEMVKAIVGRRIPDNGSSIAFEMIDKSNYYANPPY
ncbi:hypothetical protein GQ42DRAFT_54396 [Ramicandelaber brevisporus]|nr:hypothetical protein GQ42DRAFT_54396 [Ramicandelaber brevisporus]